MLRGHNGEVTSLSFDYQGKILCSGSLDSTGIVWDIETGAVTNMLMGHS